MYNNVQQREHLNLIRRYIRKTLILSPNDKRLTSFGLNENIKKRKTSVTVGELT